jgi:hypothetical protein
MVQPTMETIQSIDWEGLIPREEWEFYKSVIDNFRQKGIRFALGGGLAFSEYAKRVRNTKDLDLYVLESEREEAIQCVLSAGFHDYHDECPYDRSWIFRGRQAPVIVDLIWTAPNHRMMVDARWLTRGRDVCIYGSRLKVIPPEELIWAKLFVLQRDRCDWPDLLNILGSIGPMLDWRHLVRRLGPDTTLLGSLLAVHRWLQPDRAARLPAWLWGAVGLSPCQPDPTGETAEQRAPLLDSRDWFGPKETFEPA